MTKNAYRTLILYAPANEYKNMEPMEKIYETLVRPLLEYWGQFSLEAPY